jgi:outer membrane protein OmpA-like peptidoglycan-associated protein
MALKHIKTFESYVAINEGNDDGKFSTPELKGKVNKFKGSGNYKSKKKDQILGQLELSHNGENVLKKDKINVIFRYDPRSGKYKAEIKIKHPDYNGKLLVFTDWGFGEQELEYGPIELGKDIVWADLKPSRAKTVLQDTPSKKDGDDVTVSKTIDLDAENFFDLDKATIKPEGLKIINEFASKMKGSSVKIDGYASVEGNADHNVELSQNRAKAVANELKKKGIKVVGVKGHGGTEKFGAGAENYPKNRRVVVSVLK